MINIGITATREGLTGIQLRTIKTELMGYNAAYGENLLHQGCCVGGDEQITILAYALGYKICAHPPNNHKFYSQLAYDIAYLFNKVNYPREYLQRNRDIVVDSEVLIGAPKSRYEQPHSGTWYTINQARNIKRIRTIVVYPDGGLDEYNAPS